MCLFVQIVFEKKNKKKSYIIRFGLLSEFLFLVFLETIAE
jgi:hypothetical protein